MDLVQGGLASVPGLGLFLQQQDLDVPHHHRPPPTAARCHRAETVPRVARQPPDTYRSARGGMVRVSARRLLTALARGLCLSVLSAACLATVTPRAGAAPTGAFSAADTRGTEEGAAARDAVARSHGGTAFADALRADIKFREENGFAEVGSLEGKPVWAHRLAQWGYGDKALLDVGSAAAGSASWTQAATDGASSSVDSGLILRGIRHPLALSEAEMWGGPSFEGMPEPPTNQRAFDTWLDISDWVAPLERSIVARAGRPRGSGNVGPDADPLDGHSDLLIAEPNLGAAPVETAAFASPLMRMNVRKFIEEASPGLGISFEQFTAGLANFSIASRERVVAEAIQATDSDEERALLEESQRQQNNLFFIEQLQRAPQDYFETRFATEIRLLHHLLKGAVRHFLARFVPGMPQLSLQDLSLSLWTSVHYNHSSHGWHDHHSAGVCGVFYASVPEGAGGIEFADPRGSRFPFYGNEITINPQAGDLILFPSWLLHQVLPGVMVGDRPRVSFSFNTGSLSRKLSTVHMSTVSEAERGAQEWTLQAPNTNK